MEVSKGIFVKTPKGELCCECGKICEAFPQEELASIAKQWKTTPVFKMLFETCRQVLRDNAPRSWRPARVYMNSTVGVRTKVEVHFVEFPHLDK